MPEYYEELSLEIEELEERIAPTAIWVGDDDYTPPPPPTTPPPPAP